MRIMNFFRYSFFVITFIFSLFCLPQNSSATSGGELFIENVSMDLKKNLLYFFYRYEGGNPCESNVIGVDMTSFKEKIVVPYCDSENSDGSQDLLLKRSQLEKEAEPLYLVDMKKVSVMIENVTFEYKDLGSYFGEIKWNQDFIIDGNRIEDVASLSCLSSSIKLPFHMRMYGRDELPFVVGVISTYHSDCPEMGGYWEDTYKIFKIELPDSAFLSAKKPFFDMTSFRPEDEQRAYVSVGKALKFPDISRSLNDTGFEYYQKKNYDVASEFFAAAYYANTFEKPYTLALYNLISVESLRGNDSAVFQNIKKLFTETDEKDLYRKKMEEDPDFEKVRETREYLDTMCEFFKDSCIPKLDFLPKENEVPSIIYDDIQKPTQSRFRPLIDILIGSILFVFFVVWICRRKLWKQKK